jgi:sugar/nucleoside kinase (ribokinase family)
LLEKGQNSPGHIPAIFTQIVDTIGAGDAVVAGVIAGQINMLNLEDSVRLGTAAAALVCQGIGAQSRVFNRLDVYQLAGLRPDPKLI